MQETLVRFLVGKIRWRKDKLPNPVFLGFPCGSAGKESAWNAGDMGLIPGLGRSPGKGKGYPFQYSGLENSMDYIVHGVAKSRTQLSDFHLLDQSWQVTWGGEHLLPMKILGWKLALNSFYTLSGSKAEYFSVELDGKCRPFLNFACRRQASLLVSTSLHNSAPA